MFKYLQNIYRLYEYWKKHPMASKNMNRTMSNFIRWQFGSRILNKPVVWSWIGDTKLIVETGMTGATMNIYCGLHEFYDMAFLLNFLRLEDTFVDIGANVGTYSILASGVIGAKSISIEPVPTTFKSLSRNIAVNGISNLVELNCFGVGSIDGTELVFIADQDTTNRVAPSAYTGKTVKVPIRSVDSLLFGLDSIMWKIDVEGFEEQVLSGANASLSNKNLKVIEIEGDSPLIREILIEKGFEICTYNPFTRELIKSKDKKDNHNWLYIRDFDFVLNRCKSASLLTINNVTF